MQPTDKQETATPIPIRFSTWSASEVEVINKFNVSPTLFTAFVIHHYFTLTSKKKF